ncbi:MAG: hypothetical protein VX374_09055, partial [Pseudomonadota bacterium]|nr:hypothetical protein [Pseudomonadota bacterium]
FKGCKAELLQRIEHRKVLLQWVYGHISPSQSQGARGAKTFADCTYRDPRTQILPCHHLE